jgi:hypothetical protein
MAFVLFMMPQDAVKAYEALDGSIFQVISLSLSSFFLSFSLKYYHKEFNDSTELFYCVGSIASYSACQTSQNRSRQTH